MCIRDRIKSSLNVSETSYINKAKYTSYIYRKQPSLLAHTFISLQNPFYLYIYPILFKIIMYSVSYCYARFLRAAWRLLELTTYCLLYTSISSCKSLVIITLGTSHLYSNYISAFINIHFNGHY